VTLYYAGWVSGVVEWWPAGGVAGWRMHFKNNFNGIIFFKIYIARNIFF